MLRAIPGQDGLLDLVLVEPSADDFQAPSQQAVIDVINQLQSMSVVVTIPAGAGAASYTDLTAFNVTGIPNGAWAYITDQDSYWQIVASTFGLRLDEVIAASDGRRWSRVMIPSARWTYQGNWFYNSTTGSNLNDGNTKTTPIKTLDEFCRRLKVFSAAPNTYGVQAPYFINLQTDVPATDAFFPSGLLQSDGVQIASFPDLSNFAIRFLGFRRFIAVPTGSGALTAAATLIDKTTRSKANMTDSGAVFTTLKGRMVMVADTATAATSTGANGSISAVTAGIATFVAGSGTPFSSTSLNRLITITGSATAANNGTFPITEFLSTTSVNYSNPAAVAPDANNGAITWTEKDAKIAWIINSAPFTTGTFTSISAVSAGIATFTGGAGFSSVTDIGKRFRLSGSGAGNNDEYTIIDVLSATSVTAAKKTGLPVAEVIALSFVGVVEVGANWYLQSTLALTTAPLISSPYCVVTQALLSNRNSAVGLVNGLTVTYTDCDLTGGPATIVGSAFGTRFQLTNCRIQSGAWVAAQVSVLQLNLSCYVNLGANFVNMTFSPGTTTISDSTVVDFNMRIRESGTVVLFSNSVVQGGYVGYPSVEGAPRIGARTIDVIMAGGLGVFNNISGSLTNPTVASGSAGAAMMITRDGYLGNTGAATATRLWGIGALVGIHLKEGSQLMLGTAATPLVTDSAGSAGFSVREVKIDSDAVIAPVNTVTGAPTGEQTPVEYFKFYGVFTGGAGAVTGYMGDDVAGVSASQLQYIVQKSTTAATLKVFVTANALVTASLVQTYVNGLATGPLVTIPSPAGVGAVGTFTGTDSLVLFPGDRVDVRITNTAGTAVNMTISATVVFTNGSPTLGSAVSTGNITVMANGIATYSDALQFFTPASVGRQITITGSIAANNGTFPIQSYVGPTSVTYRNTTAGAAVDLSATIVSTETAIVSKWLQTASSPFFGNVVNYVNNTKIMRVVEV